MFLLGAKILASAPKLLKGAELVGAALGLYKSITDRQQKPPTPGITQAETDGAELQKRLGTLEADVNKLHERVGTLEANAETQAELIVHIARHEAALLRGLTVLAVALVVTSAIAIAALVIAVLR